MIKNMVFLTVGGLGLFFFGMGLMSSGLKQAAGQKLKNLLKTLTKNRFMGVLVGTLVTCLIQSSSATTVMIIGLINAGLLTLKQALGVILGANIGTTITAWLVSMLGIGALKITDYALPAIGLGFLLQLGGRKPKRKGIGSIILGLGLLFLGLQFIEEAFGPNGFNIGENPSAQQFLIRFIQNPLMGLLLGMVVTGLLQSSSATIAMLQVLAFRGAFGTDWNLVLRVTIPFILGANIGTTITAQLAAIPTARNAKRAAWAHTMFNVIGTIYVIPLVWLGLYEKFVMWITPFGLSQATIMAYMAVAHSAFNIINTIAFLPCIGWLEAIVMKILPITMRELAEKPVVLEKHLFHTPVLALEQARREIIRMAQRAKDAVQRSIRGLIKDDERNLEKALVGENITDEFQLEITSYLVTLSKEQLSDEVSNELPVLLHTVNDLERIGDHAVNIVEIAQRKIEQKLSFSEGALAEAGKLRTEVEDMFDYVITALEKNDIESAKAALVIEENLNRMQVEYRRNHVQRMSSGICSAETGLIFIDLIDNGEKIGDHLTNIAQAVIGGLRWEGVKPEVPPNTDN
jgi:phosphate:Na+ symporter